MSEKLKLNEKRLVSLYHEHRSTVIVGEILGCSDVTVASRLKALGIPRAYAGTAGRALKSRLQLPELRVVKFYKRVRNLVKTAKRFKCSTPKICQILDRHRVPRASRSRYDTDEIARLYDELGTVRAVAEKLGCCKITVSQHLRKRNGRLLKVTGTPGEKHPNWRGGITREPYPFEWQDDLKEAIRKRDGHRCRLCGEKQTKKEPRFSVHHIDYDKENLDPRNLVTLCRRCHGKTQGNRRHWQRYFKTMLAALRSG